MEKTQIKECMEYFRRTPILLKILKGFVDKYRSYDEICGKVCLTRLSAEDIENLEGFTGKNHHGKKSVSFTADGIQKILDGSRFQGVQLRDLLIEVTQGDLVSKKEEKSQKKELYLEFYQGILEKYHDTISGKWLLHAMEQHLPEERLLKKHYFDSLQNTQSLKQRMIIIMNALNDLPVFHQEYAYIPVFAAKHSGDPHWFDDGNADMQLLYYGIKYALNSQISAGSQIAAEQKHKLLFEAGLIRDSMSNDVLLYGVHAYIHGQEHQGLKGFCEQKEPLSLTLSTIVKLDSATTMPIGQPVYVVENPVVFAKLIEQKEICAICTNGQPNLAVLMILDLLVNNGNEESVLYYNGDFDPEGLKIAQRLKDRYGDKLKFWHYTVEDYESSISNKPVSESRMKMMSELRAEELRTIADCILKTGKAGYQENLVRGDVPFVRGDVPFVTRDRRNVPDDTDGLVYHQFPPEYDKNSKILILGSFPSVKSREANFYYGHPQNRFWKLLARIFNIEVPQTIEEKKAFLHANGIALWDVIASCRITGSSDNSITDVKVNDIKRILQEAQIKAIFLNGSKAYELFMKYCKPENSDIKMPQIYKMPSTSPANAAWNLERLTQSWTLVCACGACGDVPSVTVMKQNEAGN